MKLFRVFLPLCLLCCLALSFSSPAQTEETPHLPTSLFFTNEEMEIIESIAAKNPPQNTAPERGAISLGAIVYSGPDNWTIWLQGERWTPSTKHPFINLKSVEFDKVHFSVEQPGGGAREIILRPYETYHPLTGEITTGTTSAGTGALQAPGD